MPAERKCLLALSINSQGFSAGDEMQLQSRHKYTEKLSGGKRPINPWPEAGAGTARKQNLRPRAQAEDLDPVSRVREREE